MKRSVALVSVSFFLLSCATAPPPKIEGNYYRNYQYGFALELPGGAWKVTKKMPAPFRQAFVARGVSPSKIELMLFNNETQATIMVYCEKRKISGNLYTASHNELNEVVDKIEKEFKKERKEFLNTDQIKSFTYNVWLENSEVRWTLKMDTVDLMAKGKVLGQGVTYQLGANICATLVVLGSNVLTYEKNLEIFNQMWASLKYGEEYTAEGYQSK